MSVEVYQRKLASLTAEYSHACRKVTEEETALGELRKQITDLQTAQSLLQQAAESVQAVAHQQIASVVTRCLEAVFGEDSYRLEIRFKRSRGKTEAHLVLLRDDLELEDPLNEAGGGVCDVAGLGLRLAALILSRPARRRLIVADEPFRALSENYIPLLGELLVSLAEDLDVQWVIVTHREGLMGIGRMIQL